MDTKTSLSFSAFETYEQCPFRFKKLYIERVREPNNKYGLYGTAFHNLIDKIYETQNFVYSSASQLWQPIFAKESKKPRYSHISEKDLKEQENKGVRDLKTWFKMAEQERILRPCVAHEMELQGNFRQSPLKGKIDLVMQIKGGNGLLDWKTGSSDPKNLMQLVLYAIFYYKKTGIKIDWLVLFYIKTKEVVYQQFNDDIVANASKFFGGLYNTMIQDSEYLPKKNDNCYFCSFRGNGCPLYRTIDF